MLQICFAVQVRGFICLFHYFQQICDWLLPKKYYIPFYHTSCRFKSRSCNVLTTMLYIYSQPVGEAWLEHQPHRIVCIRRNIQLSTWQACTLRVFRTQNKYNNRNDILSSIFIGTLENFLTCFYKSLFYSLSVEGALCAFKRQKNLNCQACHLL